jgi:hypothetical protein
MNGYPTSMRYSRTMRQSGSQYAAAIERTRRHDASGRLIVAVVLLVIAFSWVVAAS